MDLAQEAANRHASILGFGYDDLILSRTAWIISRMHIEFVDTPEWREEVTLQTWHRDLTACFS
jgi:acyl-ACP thioesterase